MTQSPLNAPTAELLGQLKAVVGHRGFVEDGHDLEPYLTDWRSLYHGRANLVLKPASTEEAAKIVQLCAAARVGIVPQGGNTGLVGGSVPDQSGNQIVVSMSRLNRIRAVEPEDFTMTVEAGCILGNGQQAAAEVDRLFPLSLGAEGRCQIGGVISTNAGGIAVLHYGSMRDLVLGIEAVLPDGSIWNGLRRLRKDNTGYDLKHLFIGAEGTLGIVTAAVLKLFPKPRTRVTAFAALASAEAAVKLLARLRAATGDAVTSFELMSRPAIDFATAKIPNAVDPLPGTPWCALIEVASSTEGSPLQGILESALGEALETGVVLDATFAASEAQAKRLWFLREAVPEAQRAGPSVKHDISVPVSAIPEFLRSADVAVEAALPGTRPMPFGHVGDGNLHYNLLPPEGMPAERFSAQTADLMRAVHDVVAQMGGSISAEHGLGQLRRNEILRYKTPVELELMRRIKSTLDPLGIMNPGKVITPIEK
jgi:FAD/FMN-containing dehydrogenase